MKPHLFVGIFLLLSSTVPVNANTASAPVATIVSTEFVSWVTGPQSSNMTHTRWDVLGTDLGVMFEYQNQVMLAFGDTYGCCGTGPMSGEHWRSNTIGWSSDRNLADGLTLDGMSMQQDGTAGAIIEPQPDDFTVIPTAGIEVNGHIYLHYMAVRSWDSPGHWTLNRSGWAHASSPDTPWTVSETSWSADSPFGQVSLVEQGDEIYVLGIPGGRFGGVSVGRVAADQIVDLTQYQYWDGANWTSDLSSADQVVPGPVGELSVAWNDYLQSYIMLYLHEEMASIVMRTASSLTGPWSEPTVVVSGQQYPALYGAFLHPWTNGDTIYFNMSQGGPYNVGLMRTQLAAA